MEFDLVRRFVLAVVEVPGLRAPGCYVEDQDVVMVRAGMSAEERAECADWMLSEVNGPSPATETEPSLPLE